MIRSGSRPAWAAMLMAQWLVGSAIAGTNVFTPVGPEGGIVNKVTYHPTNPNIVYAATIGGFYRSTDGGAHWQLVDQSQYYQPRDIAVHPARPDKVFVIAAGSGVLSSDDAAANLTFLSSYTGGDRFGEDIEYSADGSTLYVTSGLRVYRSTDQGASWQAGGTLPTPTDLSIQALAVDPTDPNRIYVTSDRFGFQSLDGGANWLPWQLPPAPSYVSEIAIANGTPLRIWAVTNIGTYFTDDRGLSWTMSLPQGVWSIAIDPANPQVIYSASSSGVLRTTNNGASWTSIQGANPTGVQQGLMYSLALHPANANALLVSGISGIAATADGGTSWSLAHTGIRAVSAYELVVSPASDRVYMASLYDGAFAIDATNGSHTDLNNAQLRQYSSNVGVYTRGLMVQPDSPDRLLVGVLNGVARSFDAGASWQLLTHPAFINGSVHRIIPTSEDGQRLLALAGANRLFLTSDSGDNWAELLSSPLEEIREIASAPSNPQVIYLAGRLPATSNDAILRSADGGSSWTTVSSLNNPFALSLAVDPRTEQTVYVGDGRQLLKSTNGGSTWTALPVRAEEQPFYGIALDPANPDIVYVSWPSGIARSVDGGESWQELTFDALFRDARALAVGGQFPHRLYAAAPAYGAQEISVEPDLELTGNVPAAIGYGAATGFSYRVRNVGPYDATNVRTTVQLPPGATNVTATSTIGSCVVAGNVVTCTTPILRLNASADINISAVHPTSGDFTSVATVQGDQADSASTNNSMTSNVRVTELTDLVMALTAPAQVRRGDAITFSLNVTNLGPNPATTPTVTFTMASGLTVASVTPSTGCTTSGSTVTCQLATLAANASSNISIVTTATASAGTFPSTATLTATGADPVASNDSMTRSTVVNAPRSGGGGSFSPWLLLLGLLAGGGSRLHPLSNQRPSARHPRRRSCRPHG